MHTVPDLSEFRSILESNECVAVDFTATWCGPCKRIGPAFERLSKSIDGVHCVKVDVDENEETAALMSVRAMPTFVFFYKGEKVDELVGASEAQLREKMEALSARASAPSGGKKGNEDPPPTKNEQPQQQQKDPFKPPVLD